MSPIDPRNEAALLELARASLVAAARRDRAPTAPAALTGLTDHGGVFVTLRQRGGELRGCIGSFEAGAELAPLVVRTTAQSALQDPRFRPVTPAEVPTMTISLSVLTPRVECRDPDTIEVGRHGVHLALGRARAVFLPQVAPEQGWDRAALLAQLCRKAGLPEDAWRDDRARLSVFEGHTLREGSER